MKWLIGFCISMALLAVASAQPQAAQLSVEQATQRWAFVLDRFVDDRGYVDFRRLAAAPTELQTYVDWVAAVDPGNRAQLFTTRESILAYYLNAYNALAMRQVLAQDIPEELSTLKRRRFFRVAQVVVGGQTMNLEDFENNIIRKLGEPRVHWALNCMSESCPRLPREPFSAERIEQQLQRESLKFFAEPRNVRIDHEKERVYFTEIFKFFPEDFLAVAPSFIAYANRYRAADAKIPEDYKVKYIDYDWTIIQQR